MADAPSKLILRTEELARDLSTKIQWVLHAHTFVAKRMRNTVRLFDGITPYAVHPIWCAMTITQEETLDIELRYMGAYALLFHDLIEDTDMELPPFTPPRVHELVEAMTFKSFDDEFENLWSREQFVLLLKLYDKTNNWMDGAWMRADRRAKHRAHLERLIGEVEKIYGQLNIVRIAKALVMTGGS